MITTSPYRYSTMTHQLNLMVRRLERKERATRRRSDLAGPHHGHDAQNDADMLADTLITIDAHVASLLKMAANAVADYEVDA